MVTAKEKVVEPSLSNCESSSTNLQANKFPKSNKILNGPHQILTAKTGSTSEQPFATVDQWDIWLKNFGRQTMSFGKCS